MLGLVLGLGFRGDDEQGGPVWCFGSRLWGCLGPPSAPNGAGFRGVHGWVP